VQGGARWKWHNGAIDAYYFSCRVWSEIYLSKGRQANRPRTKEAPCIHKEVPRHLLVDVCQEWVFGTIRACDHALETSVCSHRSDIVVCFAASCIHIIIAARNRVSHHNLCTVSHHTNIVENLLSRHTYREGGSALCDIAGVKAKIIAHSLQRDRNP